jgi:hypothetical protein
MLLKRLRPDAAADDGQSIVVQGARPIADPKPPRSRFSNCPIRW